MLCRRCISEVAAADVKDSVPASPSYVPNGIDPFQQKGYQQQPRESQLSRPCLLERESYGAKAGEWL